MTDEAPNSEAVVTELSTAKFLQDVPPGESRELSADCFKFASSHYPKFYWAPVELYCANAKCLGFRFADPETKSAFEFSGYNQEKYVWCAYKCRNCQTFLKLYAVAISSPERDGEAGSALKIGEYPVFGPHLPPGVIELLGGDADYFLKGHRSEAQGLGIAAFAYYRRVVESQRAHIFDDNFCS